MLARAFTATTSVFLPFRALVRRELLTTLRLRRTFFLMAALVFILIIIAADQFPDNENNLSRMASQSRTFFVTVVVGLYMSCLLFVPGLSAAAFTVERERETFDLVRTSLISPVAMLWGKLFSALGVYLLFILGALPLLGFVFFMVGVDVYSITSASALMITTAFACSAAGILCSVTLRSTVRSVTASYIAVLFIMGLHIGILFFLVGIALRPSQQFFQSLMWMLTMVPFFSLVGTMIGEVSGWYAVGTSAYLLVLGTVLVLIARWRLVRDVGLDLTPAAARDDNDTPNQHASSKLPGAARPTLAHRLTPDNVNPVFWGELLSSYPRVGASFLRRFIWYCILFGAPLAFVYFAMAINGFGNDFWQISLGFFVIVAAFIALLVTATSANLFTRDRDRGNLDFLRTTLMQPWQVITGKVCIGAFQFLAVSTAALTVSLPFWLLEPDWILIGALMLGGYMSIVMTCTVALSGAMMASAWARRTTTAIAGAFAVNTMVFVGFSLGAGMFVSLTSRHLQTEEMAAAIMAPSPILLFVPGSFFFDNAIGSARTSLDQSLYILGYWTAGWIIQGCLIALFIFAAYAGYQRSYGND